MKVLPESVKDLEYIHCFISDSPCIAVYQGAERVAPDVPLEDRYALNCDLWELVNSGAFTVRLAYTGFGIVLERRRNAE